MRRSSLKLIGHRRSNTVRILTGIFIFCCCISGLYAKSYQSVAIAVYDMDDGRFLFKKNSQVRRAPASTIKVLTALTAQRLAADQMDDWVTISDFAASAQPTKAYMKPGEKFKLRDLISLTLVASCNDAARAVAEGVSGSEANFANDMQNTATMLGAQATRVTNASGLPSPSGMLTTVEDSVLMIKAASQSELISKMLSEKSVTMVSSEGRSITRTTHNRLMRDNYRYPVLGKTGFTNDARHCFLSFCKLGDRNVAVSILGAPTSSVLWAELRLVYDAYMKTRDVYLPIYMAKQGISVAQLHEKLRMAGFPVSGENTYGAATRKAVAAYQKSKRLASDGICGARTWESLSD